MKITVTITDTAGAAFEGYTVVFSDVDECQISEGSDTEEISCDAAGCEGCTSMHRRLADTARLELKATGKRNAVRNIPKAAT